MNLPLGEFERIAPLPKPFAKGTVLVVVVDMLTVILFPPQERQSDIGALEFAVQVACFASALVFSASFYSKDHPVAIADLDNVLG